MIKGKGKGKKGKGKGGFNELSDQGEWWQGEWWPSQPVTSAAGMYAISEGSSMRRMCSFTEKVRDDKIPASTYTSSPPSPTSSCISPISSLAMPSSTLSPLSPAMPCFSFISSSTLSTPATSISSTSTAELNPRIRWTIAEGRGFGKTRQAKIRCKKTMDLSTHFSVGGYWQGLLEEKEEENDDDNYDDGNLPTICRNDLPNSCHIAS